MAKILLVGNLHIVKPNVPRHSRHQLLRPKRFPSERFDEFPLEKIWVPLESIAMWRNPVEEYQLIHTFNGIPLFTKKRWIVTFEVLLPYLQSGTNLILKSILKEQLALESCKKIIALSDYARIKIINNLKSWDFLEGIINKLTIIHPNFPVQVSHTKEYDNSQSLNILFIGNHFGRKGGFCALRLAKKAQDISLPITIHLVSKMEYSQGIWTDFSDKSRYEADLKLLNLKNVVFHGQLPNQEVIELLSKSHFHLLPTLHDTYGYSVIESFSVATPVITTNVAALPEFVYPNENGYLLNLERNQTREWKNLPSQTLKNSSDEYWNMLNSTYDDLANQALQLLGEFIERADRREHYESLSAGALNRFQNFHDSRKVNDVLDNLYLEAIEN